MNFFLEAGKTKKGNLVNTDYVDNMMYSRLFG